MGLFSDGKAADLRRHASRQQAAVTMPRYRLRTLLIVLAIGPPLIAGLYLDRTVFHLISGLVAFSCLGAAIGGMFGKVLEGGILAFVLSLPLVLFSMLT